MNPDILDDEFIEEKTFNKIKDSIKASGYREGIIDGKQKVFQEYFDKGFAEGFKIAFELGKIKGKLRLKTDLEDNIPKVSTATCVLCSSEKMFSDPLSVIMTKQSEVVNSFTQILNDKFEKNSA